jgi:hypothetical protein
MDWKQTAVYGVIGAVIGGLFVAVRSSAKKPAPRDPITGDLLLRFGPILPTVGALIALGGPALMIFLSFAIKFKSKNEIYIPIVLGVLFFLGGAYIFLYVRKHLTRVNAQGLSTSTMFKKPSLLAWKDITKLSFSNSMDFKLQGANGQKAAISIFHTGAYEVVPLLRTQLPAAVAQANSAALERFCEIVSA